MRERGLKCRSWQARERPEAVAPHAGAWIEMVLLVVVLMKM